MYLLIGVNEAGFQSPYILSMPNIGQHFQCNFSFLTGYRDASRYIKKVWIADNAINAQLFDVHFYGFTIIQVG